MHTRQGAARNLYSRDAAHGARETAQSTYQYEDGGEIRDTRMSQFQQDERHVARPVNYSRRQRRRHPRRPASRRIVFARILSLPDYGSVNDEYLCRGPIKKKNFILFIFYFIFHIATETCIETRRAASDA